MSIVPSGLLAKYDEFTQHFLDDFGTSCTLYYQDKIEVISESQPSVKQRKSLEYEGNYSGFSKGGISYKTVEQTDSIIMRVYWEEKDFKKLGEIKYRDGDLVCYGLLTDLPKIERAFKMVVHSNLPAHRQWTFEKSKEARLHGLTNKEVISFWKRIDG